LTSVSADHIETQSMIGYWNHTFSLSDSLSVRLSVTLCIVALRVNAEG